MSGRVSGRDALLLAGLRRYAVANPVARADAPLDDRHFGRMGPWTVGLTLNK